MKRFALLLLGAVMLASCASQKRVWYLQDARPFTPEQILENGQIRIKPLDRLTIVVNSKDPELAVPFNSATSLASLTGGSSTGAATTLQVRTVDEHGMIEIPVIGKVDCRDKTRSELAGEIARRIVEGGYINDPTVNVQFADMKFSVLGEVARPGRFDITNDRVTLFDALAMAGDLTVYGVRNEVAVAREKDGVRTIEYVDLAVVLHSAERRDLRETQQVQGAVGRNQPEPQLLSVARRHGHLRGDARHHHHQHQIASRHGRTDAHRQARSGRESG